MMILAGLGWIGGGVVNYLSDVLPWKRKLAAPFCMACKIELPWRHSALWFQRCPHCHARRSARSWIVAIFYPLVTIWLWYNPPALIGFWFGWVLLLFFGVVVVIDIEYRLILHMVSASGAVLGLLLGVWWRTQQFVLKTPGNLATWDAGWYGVWTSLLGGLIGFGIMWLLYTLGELAIRALARLRGLSLTADDVALGFGDVNLSGVLGLILGWELIGVGLMLAVFIGGATSLLYLAWMLLRRRYHMFMALPYGPFLVSGAVFVIYFRSSLLALLQ